MANYDENISFRQGSDTGDSDAASIVPITDSEVVWSGTTNRPVENLRVRTEILRRAVQNSLYYQDYDRALVLRSEAKFSLTEPVSGSGQFVLVSTGDLWVYPALTPGQQCGGRWDGGRVFFGDYPYLGASEAVGLVLTAKASTTGQRGYFDGDSFDTATVLSLGANRIVVDLVADPGLATGVFQYAVTQSPKTHVTVTYGTASGAPSHAAFIASFNADTSSQGTYGVSQLLFASSNAVSPSTNYISAYTGAVVQGAYDAEAHKVTQGQLATFFAASVSGVYVNRLRDGEGLAIGYPAGPTQTYVSPYPKGGRRQSIFDLPTDRFGGQTDNTTPATGYSIFSTGRESEKIPGAVPIGKLVVEGGLTEFVFIDGTRVRLGEDPIALGASSAMRRDLSSTASGSSGAMMIGYSGSGAWNPNATTSPTALASGTVENALDEVVAQLGGYATNVGGARRVGFEDISGTVSAGNTALDLSGAAPSGPTVRSLQLAIERLLNDSTGGVNYRVSENGHRMHGPNPLEKLFSDAATNTGGAQLIRALLNKPKLDLFQVPHIEEQALASLMPAYFNTGIPGEVLLENEPITAGVTADSVKLSGLPQAAATLIKGNFALTADAAELHCLVQIKGSDADDGFYFAKVLDDVSTPCSLTLCTLNGDAWGNGMTLSGSATLTFFVTAIEGNSKKGVRSRRMVPASLPEAHEHVYGNGTIRRGYDGDGIQRSEESVLSAAWSLNFLASTGHSGSSSLTFASAGINLISVTGLSGMVTGDVGSKGHYLTISGATGSLAAINGSWLITNVSSSSSITISSDAVVTGTQSMSWTEDYDRSRKTSNILNLDDARLLKGIELGSVLDASANHMHASLYAPLAPDGYTYLSTPIISTLDWVNAASDLLTLDNIRHDMPPYGDYVDAADVGAFIPTGYTPTGLYLELHIVIQLSGSGTAGAAWELKIEANDGTSYDSSTSRVVFHETGHKITGSGNVDTLTRNLLVFVPCSVTGQIYMRATSFSGPLATGATTIYARLTAMANSPV